MPFLSQDESDGDDSIALKTDQAKRESARNVVTTLRNDLSSPKMYVQDVDPETGFPVRKRLVSGGLEYFNDNETGLPDATEYDIDAILSGDVSVEDAMARFDGTNVKQDAPQPRPVAPSVPAAGIDDMLRLLGFDFLRRSPSMPDKHVQLCFSGLATFQVPFACHAVVVTDSLVVLITDKRSVPVFQEMDFNVDRKTVEVTLVCPDKSAVPIVAPVPRTVSFELGILRFTLFAKR